MEFGCFRCARGIAGDGLIFDGAAFCPGIVTEQSRECELFTGSHGERKERFHSSAAAASS